MRFSTLQIKTAIVEIVRNFQITVNDRTPDPLIVMPENYLYLPVHNIFLDYAPLWKWSGAIGDPRTKISIAIKLSILNYNYICFIRDRNRCSVA